MRDLSTLGAFRHDLYDCFLRAKDALFNTADALLCESHAKSLPEITLSPHFERRWSSVYEAFEDGRIDEKRLQEVFVRSLPTPEGTERCWLALDTSHIARPCSVTARDRTGHPVHNLPLCKKAITFGWQFSTLVVLPEQASSWSYLLDQQRVPSTSTATEVGFEQLKQVAKLLPAHSILLLDRGYDATWLWARCSTLPLGVLGRIKSNRCLYRPAPAPTGKRGTPRKDGAKVQPKDLSSTTDPDGCCLRSDQEGHEVEISWWKRMHVKEARWLEITLIRVVRPHATNKERDPKISWFVWIGDQEADVAEIALGYVHRFSIEHGYRFDKQALLWEKARLRTPEQFERWSHIVALVHNQIVLARSLVERELRPWERHQRPATPAQVRRGISKLLPLLGTPARAPQPRGKSPGRAKGKKIGKAKRFAVVRKSTKLPKKLLK